MNIQSRIEPADDTALRPPNRTLADVIGRKAGIAPVVVLAIAITFVIALNTVAQIRLNAWNGDFYGALERRDYDGFITQLGVFTAIAAVLLVFVVSQTYLQEVAKVRLRERLTSNLLDSWLGPRRAFELDLAGAVGANPDQRLQEDVRHFSELSVGLGAGFVQSSLLLVTFIGVLWTLSTPVPIEVFGFSVVIPGLMLWGTLLFSITGSALTYWIGAPLVRLHQRRYAEEAEFRHSVIRVAEAAQEIAFYRGEARERETIDSGFTRVTSVTLDLARAVARVTWVTSGYGWLAIVAPVVVAAPAYFSGALTFGGLMMVVQAFYQVQQSLRWFVDNYPTIADWRATRGRVAEFREALNAVDSHGRIADDATARIVVAPHPAGRLSFEGLVLKLSDGAAVLDEDPLTVNPGERVLLVGKAGVGKSMLFRAMAGLWPWGSGRILMPPEDEIAFLSPRPYLPAGDLRATLAYPQPASRFADVEFVAALQRVRLKSLGENLGAVRRWDRELNADEQQRLSFARVVLHKPRWVFLDEAASAYADDHRTMIHKILAEELAGSAVVGLARSAATDGMYARRVRLRRRGVPPRLLRAQLGRQGVDTGTAEDAGPPPVALAPLAAGAVSPTAAADPAVGPAGPAAAVAPVAPTAPVAPADPRRPRR